MPATHPLFDLTGRTALVTGSSQGLGLALARGLAEAGAALVLNGRDATKLAAAAAMLRAGGARVATAAFDVNDGPAIAREVARLAAEFAPIDILVNNAGYFLFAALEEAAPSDYRDIFEVNFFGALEMIRAVLPGMRARRSGRIINISSMGGISGGPGAAYYAATKFAVSAISESLALEARHLGIHVTLIEPGAHRTFVVSFPRDLWVRIPGVGMAKINAAFNTGPDKVIETLKANFGVDINHYLQVDFQSFQGIVRAIGSVPG